MSYISLMKTWGERPWASFTTKKSTWNARMIQRLGV